MLRDDHLLQGIQSKGQQEQGPLKPFPSDRFLFIWGGGGGSTEAYWDSIGDVHGKTGQQVTS